jgi:hypothetical protein
VPGVRIPEWTVGVESGYQEWIERVAPKPAAIQAGKRHTGWVGFRLGYRGGTVERQHEAIRVRRGNHHVDHRLRNTSVDQAHQFISAKIELGRLDRNPHLQGTRPNPRRCFFDLAGPDRLSGQRAPQPHS